MKDHPTDYSSADVLYLKTVGLILYKNQPKHIFQEGMKLKGVAATFQARIREVMGSNLSRGTNYPVFLFLWVLSVPSAKFQDYYTSTKQWLLPFKSFPVYQSSYHSILVG
jgi:hypothetical protein